jgi:hypothetical protein
VSDLKWRVGVVPSALLATAALLLAVLTPAAGAATPAPQSATDCGGYLTSDPSGPSSGEPNLLDYQFACDGDVTGYTLVIDRSATTTDNIDDFSPGAEVIDPGGAVDSNTSFTCSGTTPGDGINCNAGAAGVMSAGSAGNGSIDPIDPYCKRLVPGAAPGTPAEPQAVVKLIVSDTTGATDGPFTLNLTPACPSVPDSTPYPAPKPAEKLSLAKHGTGSGTVKSWPSGIKCGSTCSYSYANGAKVTLTAKAAAGSTFAGWKGACTGTGPCELTMSAARNVTATFSLKPHPHRVRKKTHRR